MRGLIQVTETITDPSRANHNLLWPYDQFMAEVEAVGNVTDSASYCAS